MEVYLADAFHPNFKKIGSESIHWWWMVDVDGSSHLSADSQPKSVGLV